MHDDGSSAARALANLVVEAAHRIGADPQALAQTMDDIILRRIEGARASAVQPQSDIAGEDLLRSAWLEALVEHSPETPISVLLSHTRDVWANAGA